MKQPKLRQTGGFLPSTVARSKEFYNSFKGVRQALGKGNYEAALRELPAARSQAQHHLARNQRGRNLLRVRPKAKLPVVLKAGEKSTIYTVEKLHRQVGDFTDNLVARLEAAIAAETALKAKQEAIDAAVQIRDPEETQGRKKDPTARIYARSALSAVRVLVNNGNATPLHLHLARLGQEKTGVLEEKTGTMRITAADTVRYLQNLKETMEVIKYKISKVKVPDALNSEHADFAQHLGINTTRVEHLNSQLSNLQQFLDHRIELLEHAKNKAKKVVDKLKEREEK